VSTSAARVLGIVVVHGDAPWLPDVLDCLEAQDHPNLDIVAVDSAANAHERALLLERLGPESVFIADRDIGFGPAINLAADTARATAAEYLLLVHDDVALEADAVTKLVAAMDADPSLAAVGPKLVRWDDPRRLSSVGMTIDATGRADTRLDPDELDQGQRDGQRAVLYVSTAGMLVRRDAYEEVGRLGRRHHVFRDDLDLCWRMWLAGHDVHVVTDAVARHAEGAANYLRLGQTAMLGPRYFAERNTLATLLKLYGWRRLLAILPVYLVLGVLKVVGFLATRRVGDAWQTLRAWVWNAAHFKETMRLRAKAQALRKRDDSEIAHLFGRTAPRLRAYAEAVAFWLTTSGDAAPAVSLEDHVDPDTVRARVMAWLRGRPVTIAATVLFILGVALALPLLQSSTVRGGELASWPASASVFFNDYTATVHRADGLVTAGAPSPAVAALGVLTWLSLGSSWLAPRLLLLGAVPVAWLLALVALRGVSTRRLPQVVGATMYVVSPPFLAALRTGRISTLVLAVILPGLAAAVSIAGRPRARSSSAWRATAVAALLAAAAIAFAPAFALVVLGGVAAGLIGLAVVDTPREARRAAQLRLVTVLAGAFLLLLPWSLDLVGPGSPIFAGVGDTMIEPPSFVRLLLLAPRQAGFPGAVVGLGLVAGAGLGLVLGLRRRPGLVVGSWLVILAGVVSAWTLGRAGVDAVAWPGQALVPTAAAAAMLTAVAFSEAGETLSGHAFGWRHLAAGVTTLAVMAGLGGAVRHLVHEPWAAYAFDTPALPAFIEVEQAVLGDFRVLVLRDVDGVVSWDLTGSAGPTMLRFGQAEPAALLDRVESDLADTLSGADPGAAARLGLVGVRYVVVPEGNGSPLLELVLQQQLDLEPLPSNHGRIYRLASWLPRVAWVRTEVAEAIVNQRAVPPGRRVVALDEVAPFTWQTTSKADGGVFVADPALGTWEATADGVPAEVRVTEGQIHIDLDDRADLIEVRQVDGRRRAWTVTQLLALLATMSLVLRPPRFAELATRAEVPG